MKRPATRREFLRAAAVTAGWLALSWARRVLGMGGHSSDSEQRSLTGRAFVPDVARGRVRPSTNSTPTAALPQLPTEKPRVVHVHSPDATTYGDSSTGWYGEYVSQHVVNQMMDLGLMELTGQSSVAGAWSVLLPAYVPGQKVAIKVNLNNASCQDTDNRIDALIEPVNALIASLVTAGVQETDIWVYDALRPMPARFYGRRLYTQARFFDSEGCADERATFDRVHPSLQVAFSHPAVQTERWLTDLLYHATYLINMPILKKHGFHPVTLGFKNHFGSLDRIRGDGDDNLHAHISPSSSVYSASHSPLVDINANPNIAGKTILTVADGLFSAAAANGEPLPWETFGNSAPSSLFFSCDPVAIDCVMCDLLRAEWGLDEAAYDYLQLAQDQGLGTFERGDPWGSGYAGIEYVRVGVCKAQDGGQEEPVNS